MSSMVRTMKRAIKRRGIERSHNTKTKSESTYHKLKFNKEDIVK